MDKIIVKPIKIAFFGPQGSGRGTAADMSEEIFDELCPTHWFYRCDVESPLLRMQKAIYGILNLDYKGKDGELLKFFANKFEDVISLRCVKLIDNLVDFYNGKLICVNGDCLNNAYKHLKDNGFIFVRIKTKPSIIEKRLGEIEDTIKVDEIEVDYVVENDGSLLDLKERLKELLKKIVEER